MDYRQIETIDLSTIDQVKITSVRPLTLAASKVRV